MGLRTIFCGGALKMAGVLVDHWAYFGDGNSVKIIDSKEYIKNTGVKFVKFIFQVASRIRDMYDLEDKLDLVTNAIVKEYPVTDVIWLERGVTRSRVWIVTDFNGGPTPASRRHESLTAALNDTEKLLMSEKAAKNRAYQELSEEREQQLIALKQKTRMVREVMKAGPRKSSEDEGEDYDAGE